MDTTYTYHKEIPPTYLLIITTTLTPPKNTHKTPGILHCGDIFGLLICISFPDCAVTRKNEVIMKTVAKSNHFFQGEPKNYRLSSKNPISIHCCCAAEIYIRSLSC